MATSSGMLSQHPLGQRPSGWTSHRNHYVVLTYSVDGLNNLVFSYSEGFTPSHAARAITSIGDLAFIGLTPPAPILDLEVYADCFLEVWLDPSKNWRWSTSLDAITTKNDHSQYYFELRYVDANTPYERTQFPAGKTPLIVRFGAIRKPEPPEFHGFSLNLELIYPGQKPLPITIDPDIRNPSV